MARYRVLITTALFVLGAGVLLAVFIAFRHDTALIGALGAAGTVAAAAFAAVAAYGSVKAASESSASARQAREGVARTLRPLIEPSTFAQNGHLHGRIRTTTAHGAIDLTVVWTFDKGPGAVTAQTNRLAPARPDDAAAPTADTTFTMDLGLPDTAAPSKVVTVWIDYWDDSHVGHWRDTWQPDTDGILAGRFTQVDSRLLL